MLKAEIENLMKENSIKINILAKVHLQDLELERRMNHYKNILKMSGLC